MKIFSDILLILTIDCRKSAAILSNAGDKPLTFSEKIALKGHLFICRYCRLYNKQLGILQRIFKIISSVDIKDSMIFKSLSDKKKQQIKNNFKDN